MYPGVTSWFELSFDSSGKFYIRKNTVATIWIAWTEQWLPGRINLAGRALHEKLSVKKYLAIILNIQYSISICLYTVCVLDFRRQWLQLLVLKVNCQSSVARHSSRHCILKESINHTYNIKVKTHKTAIFVTAYLVAKI